MKLIRRAILAFALAAGLAPAFAQVPAPVPALPDTERRTSYSISGTTCACAVNMALYGDSTDFSNWIEVWLNGTRVNSTDPTFGWTITVPTGSLATRARPISDAVLTFAVAQTGTVQIVGARRPRRTQQFAENTGVPTRNLNLVFSDIIATQRELWDKTNDMTGRGIFAPPGETLTTLPPASSRQGKFLIFDGSGNPAVTSPTPGLGNVLGPGSSSVGNPAIFNNATGTLLAQGTRSGNTTQFATTTGTQTALNCVAIDAFGNHVDAGFQCPFGPQPPPYMLTNGEFLIDQEKAFLAPYTAKATSEDWGPDGSRIYCAGGTPGVFAVQVVGNVGPNQTLSNSLWLRPVTTNTAPGAGDNCHIEQWIIPALVTPLQMGTSTAKQFTFSIYAACSKTNLNWAVSFLPADNSRSFVGSLNYTVPINTFQRLSVTVPGDTLNTVAYAANGMKIILDVGFGSAFELPAPSIAWGVGASFRFAGAYSFIQDTSPPNCFFTGEQIDLGPTALPDRHLFEAAHLARAQMFKVISPPLRYTTTRAGQHITSVDYQFPQKMFGLPIIRFKDVLSGSATTTWTRLSGGVSGVASTNGTTLNSTSVLNAGVAGDADEQSNGVVLQIYACPGNIGVGSGCGQP